MDLERLLSGLRAPGGDSEDAVAAFWQDRKLCCVFFVDWTLNSCCSAVVDVEKLSRAVGPALKVVVTSSEAPEASVMEKVREEGWAWASAESEGVADLRRKVGLVALPLPYLLVFDAENRLIVSDGLGALRRGRLNAERFPDWRTDVFRVGSVAVDPGMCLIHEEDMARAGLFVGDLLLLQTPDSRKRRLVYANRSPTAIQDTDASDEEEEEGGGASGGHSGQDSGAAGEGAPVSSRAAALSAAAAALAGTETATVGTVLSCADTAHAFEGEDVVLTRVEDCSRAVTAVLEVERTGSVQGGEVVTQAGRAGWEGASPPPRPEAEILRPYFGVLSDTGRSKLMAGMRAVASEEMARMAVASKCLQRPLARGQRLVLCKGGVDVTPWAGTDGAVKLPAALAAPLGGAAVVVVRVQTLIDLTAPRPPHPRHAVVGPDSDIIAA